MLRSDDNGMGEGGTQEKEEEEGREEEQEKEMLEEKDVAALAFAMHMCFAPCTFRTLFISDIIQSPTSQAKAMSDQPDGPLDGRS